MPTGQSEGGSSAVMVPSSKCVKLMTKPDHHRKETMHKIHWNSGWYSFNQVWLRFLMQKEQARHGILYLLFWH